MEFLIFIKDIFAEKRTLFLSFGCMVILVLGSANMTLALAVGIMLTLALTISAVVTNILGRYSTDTGARIIYISIAALVSALSAVFVSVKYPDVSESFSLVAAILPVSGLAAMYYSKNDSVMYASVRSFTTGLILTAALFALSFIREFFGGGTLFGMEITDYDVPFLRGNYGALILCGVILSLINTVSASKMTKNAKKLQKKSINTEADDADS